MRSNFGAKRTEFKGPSCGDFFIDEKILGSIFYTKKIIRKQKKGKNRRKDLVLLMTLTSPEL